MVSFLHLASAATADKIDLNKSSGTADSSEISVTRNLYINSIDGLVYMPIANPAFTIRDNLPMNGSRQQMYVKTFSNRN